MTRFSSILNSIVNPTGAFLLYTFDDIKTDYHLHFQEKILTYKRGLAGSQKNKSWQQEIYKFLTRVSPHFQNKSICANHWAVAVEVSDYVLETAKRLPNWCIVVVVGMKEYTAEISENLFLLNSTVQSELAKISEFYKASLQLPNGLYTVQKNLGYLWAIFHEAAMIWDFEIVHEMIVNESVLLLPRNETVEALTMPHYNSTLLNPFSFLVLNSERLSSRGYPFRSIDDIRANTTGVQTLHGVWPTKNLAVINSLIEGCGYTHDYWGYHLAKLKLPLYFNTIPKNSSAHVKLIVPRRTFSPYDQQATLHLQPALWAILLPVTVQQQISDILRSYVMQRLMWDVDLQVAFVGSFFTSNYGNTEAETARVGFRKSESYCHVEKDFNWKIDDLLQFLTQWSTNKPNFIEHTEQLFIALYKHGYIKIFDVYLLQIWLQELYQIGYIFPEVVT